MKELATNSNAITPMLFPYEPEHREGMLKTMLYLEAFRNQIDVLLKKLNHGQ